jgi:hypothetical protein
MNDIVKRIMQLADNFALQTRFDLSNTLTGKPTEAAPSHRQALQDELTRLFTPLTDAQAMTFLRDECIYASDDMCGWSFGQGVKWAEQKHGITGESK